MKHLLSITALILGISMFVPQQVKAQTPEGFKYQAIIRDATSNVLANQPVGVQIGIVQASQAGTIVYTETFTPTTNQYGLINLNIGEGTSSDIFEDINWVNGPYFIKLEVDVTGGTNYADLGTSPLKSVPFALLAKDIQNKQILNLSNDTLYLTDGGQVYLGNYTNNWATHGDDIYNTNSKNIGVGIENPMGKLVVQGDTAVSDTLPLFEVKNKDGITVFAVYDGGVRVYVNDDPAKANNDKSGFAIGGYRLDKSVTNEYLRVTPDSVRVYIKDETDPDKANNKKGGFAIGGYRLDKSSTDYLLNVYSGDTSYVINPSEARIMWYPAKEAFMAGRVLVESPDSVGMNSWATGFESKSIGNYSQALGYRARAYGNNSTAIGYYANAIGSNSYAFGNYATTQDSGSYALGTGAIASGLRSFAVGSSGIDSAGVATSPTKALGDYSYAFGMGSVALDKGAFAFGIQDTALAEYSLSMGYQTYASGWFSTSLGKRTEATGMASFASGAFSHATGDYSTAIGISTEASGNKASAFGDNTVASGYNSLTMGNQSTASGSHSTAIGYWAEAIGQSSLAMGDRTTASGTKSTSIGDHTTASGESSISMGNNTLASGNTSTAMGYETQATNFASTAMGRNTIASGNRSTAIGNFVVASGNIALAMGNATKSNGTVATTMGSHTIANSYIETVLGSFNDTTTSTDLTNWVNTNPIFIIGNGQYSARHNALTVLKNGNIGFNTNTPTHTLTINSSASPIDSLALRLIGPNDTVGYGALLNFGDANYVYLQEYADNKLKIHANQIVLENKVGIGTYNPDKTLTVQGDARITGNIYYGAIGSASIYTKPDFVFKPEYKFHKIDYIENFITKNGHLPWLTASKDEKDGVNMTRMSFQTLEAVENQQLQIINLRKENSKLQNSVDNQQILINKLIKRLDRIEKKIK